MESNDKTFDVFSPLGAVIARANLYVIKPSQQEASFLVSLRLISLHLVAKVFVVYKNRSYHVVMVGNQAQWQ